LARFQNLRRKRRLFPIVQVAQNLRKPRAKPFLPPRAFIGRKAGDVVIPTPFAARVLHARTPIFCHVERL
jgi:hypothetical protein